MSIRYKYMSITNSKGVNRENSDSLNGSYGVNTSSGVNWSSGVNGSYSVNGSNGVNWSYGIFNSYGVDNAIFLADKLQTYSIFGVNVSKDRFDEVWTVLFDKLNGWYPKFNNAFDLYMKNGNSWSKIDASEITSTLKKWNEPFEAWKDMPKEAIEYVKSLPEFNPEMFKRITGIDTGMNIDK